MSYRNPRWSPEFTGRKPSFNDMGALRLNPDHPSSEGLVFECLLDGGASNNSLIGPKVVAYNPGSFGCGYSSLGRGGLFVRASSTMLRSITTPVVNVPLTIAAWFKVTADGTSNNLVTIGDETSANSNLFSLNAAMATVGDPLRAIVLSSSAVSRVADIGHLSLNILYFGAARFLSDSNRSITLNGVLGNTNVLSNPVTSTSRICIGATAWNTPGNYADAEIYEVLIWNRHLTVDELSEIYRFPYGTPSNPRFLVMPQRTWFVPSGTVQLYSNVIGSGVGASAPCVIGS